MLAIVSCGQIRNGVTDSRNTLNSLIAMQLMGAFLVDCISPVYTSTLDAVNQSETITCDEIIRPILLQSTHRCHLLPRSGGSQRSPLRCDGFPLELVCRRPRKISAAAAVFSHRIPIDGSNLSLCTSLIAAAAVHSDCSSVCLVQSIGSLCNGRQRCLLSTPDHDQLTIAIVNNRCASDHLRIQYSCGVEPKLTKKSRRKPKTPDPPSSCPPNNISAFGSAGGRRLERAGGREEQRMQGEDALILGNVDGRTSIGKSTNVNESVTNYTDEGNDFKRLIADWIWTASFISDHFEKTVLYLVLGIMVGLLILLSVSLCLTLTSIALRRRKKRRMLKRLSSSSRTNTSTQTAESSTLIPSPSEHDFGLELLRFMHNGPPVKRDDRSVWLDALERQPLKAPLSNSPAPLASVGSHNRLCVPVSSDRSSDSYQHECAQGRNWYSRVSCEDEAFSKDSQGPLTTNSPNQISPCSADFSSRGLMSNCTTRDHLETTGMSFVCRSSDQLHQPRGVSSFLQVQPQSYGLLGPAKEMIPNAGQSPFELSSIENETTQDGSLVILANTSSAACSKGLSRSLQNSPRDTGTGVQSFESFYSNPNRHNNVLRLTSRSTQMLSN